MAHNLTPQDLVFLVAVLLSHALLVTLVAARRVLRGRAPGPFVIYLVLAVTWVLFTSPIGLRVVWPVVRWERLAPYALLWLGVVFLDFARAFLHLPRLPVLGWLSAAGVAAVLVVLDTGTVTLPPLSLPIGMATLTAETLILLLGASAAVIYAALGVATVVVAYARRPSPLHRNRITYWLLAVTVMIAGLALVSTRQTAAEVVGAGLHGLGAALITYALIHPQLPDIAAGLRREMGYLMAILVSAALVTGLSVGVVFLLSLSPLFRLKLDENLFFGVMITGLLVFMLYQPLNSQTRRGVDRLLFGPRYAAERVIREYSQAISQIVSLEALALTAMNILDHALRIQRGTLLVVEESREAEWRLRVIPGLNVTGGQAGPVLLDGTPLADWLVKRGALLHQYTMDVGPQFESLSLTEREAWRRLGMEVFIPVRRSQTLVGVMAIGLQRSGRPYDARALELLVTLADQTAVALENATLFDRVQRRAEQLALLNKIGRQITASLEVQAILELLTAHIENAFKATAGFIFLSDEDRGDLILKCAFGRKAPVADSFRVRPGEGLVGWVAAEAKPVFVSNLPRDSRYDPAVEGVLAPEAKLALAVPISARRKSIGVILIVDPAQISLGITELNLLESIASFASTALENARLFYDLRLNLAQTLAMKNLMDSIFASIPSGVISTDLEGKVIIFSHAAEFILGIPAGAIVGKPSELLLRTLDPLLDDLMRKVKEQDFPIVGEEISPHVPGRGAVNLRLSLSPLKDARNSTIGVTMVIDDLTEHRKLESERVRIRQTFERVVAPSVVATLLSGPSHLQLGGHRQEITALFADVHHFSAFSEHMPPEVLIEVLNNYLSLAAQAVLEQQGTLDKFMGDAVMAIFNAPIPQLDHPLRAVKAALRMRETLDAHRHLLGRTYQLYFSIGIAVGEAVVGNVGSPELFNYTVLGDVVNLAKRLQENAGPGQILLNEAAYLRVREYVEAKALPPIQVKGRSALEQVCDVIRLRPDL